MEFRLSRFILDKLKAAFKREQEHVYMKLKEAKAQILLLSNNVHTFDNNNLRESLDNTLINSYFNIFDKTLKVYRSNTYRNKELNEDYIIPSPEKENMVSPVSTLDISTIGCSNQPLSQTLFQTYDACSPNQQTPWKPSEKLENSQLGMAINPNFTLDTQLKSSILSKLNQKDKLIQKLKKRKGIFHINSFLQKRLTQINFLLLLIIVI